jgi:hypothetical protein
MASTSECLVAPVGVANAASRAALGSGESLRHTAIQQESAVQKIEPQPAHTNEIATQIAHGFGLGLSLLSPQIKAIIKLTFLIRLFSKLP